VADYTYASIRAGLVANLAPLGLQSKGYVLGSPSPPTIECFPSGVQYDAAMQRGMDELTWTVRITVALTLDVPAQEKLDQYLAKAGSLSVKALIESEPTLGGSVDDLHVSEATGYQLDPDTGQKLSADWTVNLIA
jgi:hypothetical protein